MALTKSKPTQKTPQTKKNSSKSNKSRDKSRSGYNENQPCDMPGKKKI